MKNIVLLSFIVIGRNESHNIAKCLNSIYGLIKITGHLSSEVIYVDSNSTDDTLNIIQKYKHLRLVKLSGIDVNSAFARNYGAKIAKGEYLCFLDADMEVVTHGYTLALEWLFSGSEIVSGNFINCFLSDNGSVTKESLHHNNKNDILLPATGGMFMVTHKLWIKLAGMRVEFRRSQDLDFALRAAVNGVLVYRIKEVMVKHYTRDYYSRRRFWTDLLQGQYLYSGLLIRKNILNVFLYKTYFKQNSSSFLLAILLSFSFIYNIPYIMFIYFLSILL